MKDKLKIAQKGEANKVVSKGNVLELQIPPKVINGLLLVIVLFVGSLLFVYNAEAIAVTIDGNISRFDEWMHTEYFWRSYVTILVLWLCVFSLTGSLFASFVFMETITFVWGVANRMTYMTRNKFIEAADLGVANEAAKVQVDVLGTWEIMWTILLILGCVCTLVLWWLCYKRVKKVKVPIWSRISGVCVSVVLFTAMYAMHPVEVRLFEVNSYEKAGTVVWFGQSFFYGSQENISLEMVEEIYEEFEKEYEEMQSVEDGDVNKELPVSDVRPNIIVIMSESFWDIGQLGESIEMSENPMDDYYELTKKGISGHVAVNTYGGGTVTSEYEFLSGVSARSIAGVADWYELMFSKKQESLVSYLEELGYYNIAMHPTDGKLWSRTEAYPNMGFKQFYKATDFENTEKFHGYISDKSLTKEIISKYEKQKENNPKQPMFTFAVSVQNHIQDLHDSTELNEGNQEIVVEVQNKELSEKSKKDLEEYVNGLDESVAALEELVSYFEECEDETVIVFFGDHAPDIYGQLYDTREIVPERNHYRTPYFIWSNYKDAVEEYGDVNLSYLSSVLIDYLELPRPRQYYANEVLRRYYPVNTEKELVVERENGEDKLLDMQRVAYYMNENFSQNENAISYWEISE